MSWGKFAVGEIDYDLCHLDPFTLTVKPKDPAEEEFRVLVSFGCHTFTEKWTPGDADNLKFVNGAEQRRFCTTRHSCSVHLPTVVRSARKAFFTGERNYLIADNIPNVAGPYAVFFNLERSRLKGVDAAMFVVSAYEKPNLPDRKRLDSITLPTLVGKTVRGETIKPPPKRK